MLDAICGENCFHRPLSISVQALRFWWRATQTNLYLRCLREATNLLFLGACAFQTSILTKITLFDVLMTSLTVQSNSVVGEDCKELFMANIQSCISPNQIRDLAATKLETMSFHHLRGSDAIYQEIIQISQNKSWLCITIGWNIHSNSPIRIYVKHTCTVSWCPVLESIAQGHVLTLDIWLLSPSGTASTKRHFADQKSGALRWIALPTSAMKVWWCSCCVSFANGKTPSFQGWRFQEFPTPMDIFLSFRMAKPHVEELWMFVFGLGESPAEVGNGMPEHKHKRS